MSANVCFHVDPVLDVDFMFDVQIATHLKGLADKAKLNEKHVKIAWIYKAKAVSLTSERTEQQEQAQRMTEEVERLKSDLKQTTSARARAESREDEVRNSLSAVEGELQKIRGELQLAQSDLIENRDGLKTAQYELQMVRDELITSQGELHKSREELRAANGDLNDKITQLEAARREASEARALLEVARREASEAVNSAEQLNEECWGLRGDLHQQVTLVAQRDDVIGKLRDQANAQWASRWLAFQQKVVHVYSDLDFNFDLPSDEEAEESFYANYSQEPGTPAEGHSPSSSSVPPTDG